MWANAKCEFNNTIRDKTIYADAKTYEVKTRAVWADALAKVTAADWAANVHHVEKEISKDWQKEVCVQREPHPPVFIRIEKGMLVVPTNFMY